MKTFTIDDIKDKDRLNRLVQEETRRIYESSSARKNRSSDEISAKVLQGKVAELYLVETGRFEFADLKWHDLKNQRGEFCEVKAYDVNDWNAPLVKKDIERYRTEAWSKATWYYLFQCRYAEYKLLAVLRIK
jgi:hypothetical protein